MQYGEWQSVEVGGWWDQDGLTTPETDVFVDGWWLVPFELTIQANIFSLSDKAETFVESTTAETAAIIKEYYDWGDKIGARNLTSGYVPYANVDLALVNGSIRDDGLTIGIKRAPDTDSMVGIQSSVVTSAVPWLRGYLTGLDHGMTDILPTGCALEILPGCGTIAGNGGVIFRASSDSTGISPLKIEAVNGSTASTISAAGLVIEAWKGDGTTRQAITGTEKILSLKAGASVQVTVFGNGDIDTSGKMGIGTTHDATGSLKLATIPAYGSAATVLLTSVSGVVSSRTVAEVLTDIAACPLAHKTTEDAINGIVKCNGSGTYSAVTDNSGNWNTAYGWGNWASNFGTTVGTICQGNDSRLSDSRTPAAHVLDGAVHTVSGKTAGHFLKALTASTFGFAAHGLTYSDVGAQPVDATLTALAGLATSADNLILCTNTDTFSVGQLTNAYISSTAAISRSKLADIATQTILGRSSPGTGAEEQLSLSSGAGLSYTWATNSLSIGRTTDTPRFAGMGLGVAASVANVILGIQSTAMPWLRGYLTDFEHGRTDIMPTDCALEILPGCGTNISYGGVKIRSASANTGTSPLKIEVMNGSDATTLDAAGLTIQAWKGDGTTIKAIAGTEKIVSLCAGSSEVANFSAGDTIFNIRTYIGSSAIPWFRGYLTNFAHGMTDIMPADCALEILPGCGTNVQRGGVIVRAASDYASVSPFKIEANNDNTSPSAAAFVIEGWKGDGTTRQELSGTEKILSLCAGSSEVVSVDAAGEITADSIEVATVNFSGSMSIDTDRLSSISYTLDTGVEQAIATTQQGFIWVHSVSFGMNLWAYFYRGADDSITDIAHGTMFQYSDPSANYLGVYDSGGTTMVKYNIAALAHMDVRVHIWR
jgi:hypothetical protein